MPKRTRKADDNEASLPQGSTRREVLKTVTAGAALTVAPQVGLGAMSPAWAQRERPVTLVERADVSVSGNNVTVNAPDLANRVRSTPADVVSALQRQDPGISQADISVDRAGRVVIRSSSLANRVSRGLQDLALINIVNCTCTDPLVPSIVVRGQ